MQSCGLIHVCIVICLTCWLHLCVDAMGCDVLTWLLVEPLFSISSTSLCQLVEAKQYTCGHSFIVSLAVGRSLGRWHCHRNRWKALSKSDFMICWQKLPDQRWRRWLTFMPPFFSNYNYTNDDANLLKERREDSCSNEFYSFTTHYYNPHEQLCILS